MHHPDVSTLFFKLLNVNFLNYLFVSDSIEHCLLSHDSTLDRNLTWTTFYAPMFERVRVTVCTKCGLFWLCLNINNFKIKFSRLWIIQTNLKYMKKESQEIHRIVTSSSPLNFECVAQETVVVENWLSGHYYVNRITSDTLLWRRYYRKA